MIGTTVGHYKIESKLGEGGMGVVYKAQDTKLDRTVALKFLPPHVSIDDETKARFMQEAKAAAALNHAHICTVHGVEDVGDQIFIVMEYIEGGTLRKKLPYQNLDEAITTASRIAEALSEAHAKGIVHRDIKADNIMLTAKGQAKVMDFGLAKLKGSLKLTRTSSTVGTLAYMAPEQIQGGEVDSRSDIFSFGVLLFEMLTGKTPFRGEHEAAMVYSIVNEEPQSIEQLRPDTPPLLVGLIQKCLEKDPGDRYQHMEDIVSELRRSQKKTSRVMRTSSHVPVQPQTAAPATGPVSETTISAETPVSASPIIRYGAYGAIVLVLAVVGWFLMAPKGITINQNMTTRVLQIPFTQFSYPSLSPDGKWIAFPAADANGKWDIYYMHVSGGEPRKVTSDGTSFIQQSASISSDGSQILYNRPNENKSSHDLYIVSALGGTSRKLAEGVSGVSLRPDDRRAGFIRANNSNFPSESGLMEFWTVGTDGTDLRREFVDTAFVMSNYRYGYCWSPDGGSIAWIRTVAGSRQVIILHDLGEGEELQLTHGDENIDDLKWTVDDRIIFSSNRGGNTNLWAIPASGGEAVQVTKGAGPDIGISIAASGNSLVYLQQQRVSNIWVANANGSSPRQITFDDREAFDGDISPDGRRIAFIMTDPDPLKVNQDVYVMDNDGNNRRQLTNGLVNTLSPAWSPDGRTICFTMVPTGEGADTGRPRLYKIEVDDPGPPERIGEGFAVNWFASDYVVCTFNGTQALLTQISTRTTRRFFHDSALVTYLGPDGTIGYYDQSRKSRGWWTATIDPGSAQELFALDGEVIMPRFRGEPRSVYSTVGMPYSARWVSTPSPSGLFVDRNDDRTLRLLSFTKLSQRTYNVDLPPARALSLSLTDDEKQMVFSVNRLNSRLVLAEHVFE